MYIPEVIMQYSKCYRGVEPFDGIKVIVVEGSLLALDAIHGVRTVTKSPGVSSLKNNLLHLAEMPFTHPDILVRPPISEFDASMKRVELTDSASIDHVDMILCEIG
jgi:hypothetical protein